MNQLPPLRLIIVDDEPLAIDRLERLVGRVDGFTIVGHAATGAAALALAREQAPDLCLLDIAMPDISGIEVARVLSTFEPAPKVIFVTAFDRFAVAAFDAEAVDYLVKPVEPDRLARALERARQQAADSGRVLSAHITDFWVPEPQGLRRISAGEVDQITAERDYVRIHAGTRSWLVNDSLSRLEQDLDPRQFMRVHRGTIVNQRFITGVRYEQGGWMARLRNGSEQRVGRVYAANLRALRAGLQRQHRVS